MPIIMRHMRNCSVCWSVAGVRTGMIRICLFTMYSYLLSTGRHGLGFAIANEG